MNKTPCNRSGAKRGSAFIVVLGMMAVMVLMGVAFATFIRTEQAGSTNLKNSLVARQSLNTAIGRVMEAIDLSFGGVSNEWPVCVWPEPWISSSEAEQHDFYQSAALSSKEMAKARIVTKEVADLLTPEQLALARSATCDWAPIYASVDVSTELGAGEGQYGNVGVDAADSVVGRYAFIVLETTGLLDANYGGTPDGEYGDAPAGKRVFSFGEDPRLFVLPDGDAEDWRGRTIPNALLDPDAFDAARGDELPGATGEDWFTSGANLRGRAAAESWDRHGNKIGPAEHKALDWSVPHEPGKAPPKSPDKDFVEEHFFPVNSFNLFTPSLPAMDPDGEAAVVLPTDESIKSWKTADAKGFSENTLRAMVKTCLNSVYDAGENGASQTDFYTIFPGVKEKEYDLSRARLATVALLDAMDPDFMPGVVAKSADETSGFFPPWQSLPDMTVETSVAAVAAAAEEGCVGRFDLKSTTDFRPPTGIRGNPLNFPCTEPVPMVNSVYAYVEFDPDSVDWDIRDPEDSPEESTVTFEGTIHLGAVASYLNLCTNDGTRSFSLEVECEALFATPDGGRNPGTVSSVADSKEADVVLGFIGDASDPGSSGTVKREWSCSELKDFAGGTKGPEQGGFSFVQPLEFPAGTKTDISLSGSGTVLLQATMDIPFAVTCHVAEWPKESTDPGSFDPGGGPGGDSSYETDIPDFPGAIKYVSGGGDPGGGDPGGGGGDDLVYWFYPPTEAEEKGDSDLFLPFRFHVSVRDEKANAVVQTVPAPALCGNNPESEDESSRGYWIRVDAGFFHGDNSSTKIEYKKTRDAETGYRDKTDEPWQRVYAPGWAMCVDPAFAFDTTSLRGKGASASEFSPPSSCGFWVNDAVARSMRDDASHWEDLCSSLEKKDAGKNDLAIDANDPGASRFNYLQKTWLFGSNGSSEAWTDWIAPGAKTFPDGLHSASKGGGSFSCLLRKSSPGKVSRGSFDLGKAQLSLLSHIENRAFRSPGELGAVRVGPFETLSLFRTFRPGSHGTDFHRVLDYFTVSDAKRFNGLVNPNAPPVLQWMDENATRVLRVEGENSTERKKEFVRNPFPVMAALQGAPAVSPTRADLPSGRTPEHFEDWMPAVDADAALDMASAIVRHAGLHVGGDQLFKTKIKEPDPLDPRKTNEVWRFEPFDRRIVSRLSDIGAGASTNKNEILENGVFKALWSAENQNRLDNAYETDADREAILANSANAFTVRGQTFLVILRADAYTPRYGEETADDGEGTTLATTHAVLELFRDPRYARRLDGDASGPPVDKDGNPVFFHNWYIKSMRIL